MVRRGGPLRESFSSFPTEQVRDTVFCLLWSTFHYRLYQARTNCRDFNPSDLVYPPLPASLSSGIRQARRLRERITERLETTSETAEATYKVGGTVRFQLFRPRFAKPILDEIDAVLAEHYGFTPEELDFILNYDIKYRLGADGPGSDAEASDD